MRMLRAAMAATAVTLTSAALTSGTANAQFYKGKTLNVIINYGAGGNTDIQGRAVMRFMEKHIEGNPRIVIRNMAGAGGAVGANYMVQAAPKDGTTMGVFTTPWVTEAAGDKSIAVSLLDLAYIGSIGQDQITHIRKELMPGPDPYDFLKIGKSFKSAGHAPASSKDLSINLTLKLLGIKHEHVSGFKAASAIRRAILQNEVQYTEDSLAGYYGRVVSTLIEPGISVPLWHYGELQDDGSITRSKTAPKGLPTFYEFYKKKHGANAKTSGLDWDVYIKLVGSRAILRTIVMPKGAPKEALEALRAAWLKTTKDAGYLEDYMKANKSELEAKSGPDAEKAITRLLKMPAEVKAHFAKLSK